MKLDRNTTGTAAQLLVFGSPRALSPSFHLPFCLSISIRSNRLRTFLFAVILLPAFKLECKLMTAPVLLPFRKFRTLLHKQINVKYNCSSTYRLLEERNNERSVLATTLGRQKIENMLSERSRPCCHKLFHHQYPSIPLLQYSIGYWV